MTDELSAASAGPPGHGSTAAWYATPVEASEFARTTGFALFPSELSWEGGKWMKRPRPRCMWKAESTSDPAGVIALWEKYASSGDPDQRSMVAIHCGKSGIFVVDEDYPERVPAAMKEALDRVTSDGSTHVRTSVSRGYRHVYFRQPVDGFPVLDSAYPGGEIKGDGFVAVSTLVVSSTPPTAAPPAVMEWTTRGPAMVMGSVHRPRLQLEKLDDWVTFHAPEPRVSDPGSFLRRPIDRFWDKVRTSADHRRQLARQASASMFIEAMAGCYHLNDAIGSLLDAYRTARESTPANGWNNQRLTDYLTMWTTLADHYEGEVPIRVGGATLDLKDAVLEKIDELGGAPGGPWVGVTWNPDEDEEDAFVVEFTERLRDEKLAVAGETADAREARERELTERLARARSSDAESSVTTAAPDRSPCAGAGESTTSSRAEALEGPENLPGSSQHLPADAVARVSSELTDADRAVAEKIISDIEAGGGVPASAGIGRGTAGSIALNVLKEYAYEQADLDPQVLETTSALARILTPLDEESRQRHVEMFIEAGMGRQRAIVAELERLVARGRASEIYRDVVGNSSRVRVESESLLDMWSWQEVKAPDALVRTDGVGLLRTGGTVHAVFGDAGSGKTTLGLCMAIEQTRLGRDCVWVDYEMGKKRLTNWLLRLGAGRDTAERFWVIDLVGHDGSLADALAAVDRRLEELSGESRTVSWLGLDSLSRAVHRLDTEALGGENDSSNFIAVIDSFVARLSDRGISTYLIDHVGHSDKSRMRGTSAKLQQVDVALQCEVLVPWSQDSTGAAQLTCRKDRDGYFTVEDVVCVAEMAPDLTVDERERPLAVTLMPPGEVRAVTYAVEKDEREEVDVAERKARRARGQRDRMRENSCEVLGCLGEGETMSTRKLFDEVVISGASGNRAQLTEVLYELEREGVVVSSPGPNRSTNWRLAGPSDAGVAEAEHPGDA